MTDAMLAKYPFIATLRAVDPLAHFYPSLRTDTMQCTFGNHHGAFIQPEKRNPRKSRMTILRYGVPIHNPSSKVTRKMERNLTPAELTGALMQIATAL